MTQKNALDPIAGEPAGNGKLNDKRTVNKTKITVNEVVLTTQIL